jgi:two-component system nitrogen regulation sensor histidine kinase GlnL
MEAASENHRFHAFDWLATPIAVLESNGTVVFVNSELEDVIGQSRRSLEGESFLNFFSDPQPLLHALSGAKANEFAALRYDAELLRINPEESLPVHVIVAQSDQSDEVIIELLPIQQQTRQDREERLIDQAQANKELIRNLALGRYSRCRAAARNGNGVQGVDRIHPGHHSRSRSLANLG